MHEIIRLLGGLLIIATTIGLVIPFSVLVRGYRMYWKAVKNKPIRSCIEELRKNPAYTPIDKISPCFQFVILFSEDKKFFSHRGYVIKTMYKAFLLNRSMGRIITGGSSITQQLAKNLYFTPQKTYRRKIAELFVVFQLERSYSKLELLELYCNIIYFGQNCTGIRAAAEHYFQCDPGELTLKQSIMLAAIVPNPDRFDPAQYPLRARRCYTQLVSDIYIKGCISKEEAGALLGKEESGNVGSEETMKEILKHTISGLNRNRSALPILSSEDCNVRQAEVVETTDCIHIFFHSLILYPELAFRESNPMRQGYDDWMITRDEFYKILDQLYSRGYIIVDQEEFILGITDLPKGKLPLIISFDDVNYYKYMRGSGFANRLLVDESNAVVAEVYPPDSSEPIYTTEGDGVTILERYLSEHPDFSHHGARGILAVTGYEGILGYRFTDDTEDAEELRTQAKKVADRLKELGWKFACHSHTHNGIWFNVEEMPLEKIKYDTKRWHEKIGPVVGKTSTYISPFGFICEDEDPCYRSIIETGFDIFCNVDHSFRYQRRSDHYVIPRANIDGFCMKHRWAETNEKFFHVDSVVDPQRPSYKAIMQRTGKGLVDFAVHCCDKLETRYVFGAIGEQISNSLLEDVFRKYPEAFSEERRQNLKKLVGQRVYGFDCSGLIKTYVFGGLNLQGYDETRDYNSAMMLQNAPVKGAMDSLPEIPGLCLYLPGHVGIYIGNGEVIEATCNPKFGDGVVRTKLSDRVWEQWFAYPGIDYEGL